MFGRFGPGFARGYKKGSSGSGSSSSGKNDELDFDLQYNGTLSEQVGAGGPVDREAALGESDYMLSVKGASSGSYDVDDVEDIEIEVGEVSDAYTDPNGDPIVFDADVIYDRVYDASGSGSGLKVRPGGKNTKNFFGFDDMTFTEGADLAYKVTAYDDSGNVIDEMADWDYLDSIHEPTQVEEAGRAASIIDFGIGGTGEKKESAPVPEILENDPVAQALEKYETWAQKEPKHTHATERVTKRLQDSALWDDAMGSTFGHLFDNYVTPILPGGSSSD